MPRQRKFMRGQNFSGTENGIWNFSRPEITPDDFISLKLQSNFQKAMKSYSKLPTWVERICTTDSPNNHSKDNSKSLDYINKQSSELSFNRGTSSWFDLLCSLFSQESMGNK